MGSVSRAGGPVQPSTLTRYGVDHLVRHLRDVLVYGDTQHLNGHPVQGPEIQASKGGFGHVNGDRCSHSAHRILFWMAKSFLSSSVVSGQKAVLYKRDMMYFSTWSITCSTDSEEPAERRLGKLRCAFIALF